MSGLAGTFEAGTFAEAGAFEEAGAFGEPGFFGAAGFATPPFGVAAGFDGAGAATLAAGSALTGATAGFTGGIPCGLLVTGALRSSELLSALTPPEDVRPDGAPAAFATVVSVALATDPPSAPAVTCLWPAEASVSVGTLGGSTGRLTTG